MVYKNCSNCMYAHQRCSVHEIKSEHGAYQAEDGVQEVQGYPIERIEPVEEMAGLVDDDGPDCPFLPFRPSGSRYSEAPFGK